MKNCRIRPSLEVIVCSVKDSIEAQHGGAHRLEIVRDLDLGGLTPSIEVVEEIRQAVTLPARVMLRESSEHKVRESDIILRLEKKAEKLSSLGVEGVVLGFLTDDGQIDLPLTRRILATAPDLKATFHRAFDETVDPVEEILRLKTLAQVDRILSDGGAGDWKQKAERLIRYQRAANPEMTILVGGGLTDAIIKSLYAETSLHAFHVGKAARIPQTNSGKVHRSMVRDLVGALT